MPAQDATWERLRYRDHRRDPEACARELGIPLEAVEVYLSRELIDLLTASFAWTQVLPRYDLGVRHRPRLRDLRVLGSIRP